MLPLTFQLSSTYNFYISIWRYGRTEGCPKQGAKAMTTTSSEEALLDRIHKQQLVESLEHMSPTYLEGIKRILTVSADTELISAPAYYHAAVHAPTLNAFGSAVSIIQDEMGHAHIAYRLLLEKKNNTEEWIFDRDRRHFKNPYSVEVP